MCTILRYGQYTMRTLRRTTKFGGEGTQVTKVEICVPIRYQLLLGPPIGRVQHLLLLHGVRRDDQIFISKQGNITFVKDRENDMQQGLGKHREMCLKYRRRSRVSIYLLPTIHRHTMNINWKSVQQKGQSRIWNHPNMGLDSASTTCKLCNHHLNFSLF